MPLQFVPSRDKIRDMFLKCFDSLGYERPSSDDSTLAAAGITALDLSELGLMLHGRLVRLTGQESLSLALFGTEDEQVICDTKPFPAVVDAVVATLATDAAQQ